MVPILLRSLLRAKDLRARREDTNNSLSSGTWARIAQNNAHKKTHCLVGTKVKMMIGHTNYLVPLGKRFPVDKLRVGNIYSTPDCHGREGISKNGNQRRVD